MFFVMDESAVFSAGAIKNTVIGGLLEFVAILTVYYSYKYIEASRSSIVQSLKGIVVLIVSYLVFGILPLQHQLVGGIITVVGVLIMALAQAGFLKNPFSKKHI
jgi:drug/metabolite transporter (DMT)-like permease